MMKVFKFISDYLETYQGRDKFLRTLSYVAKFVTVLPKSKVTSMKWNKFASQISKCRVILRLFDDIPLLNLAINYEWFPQEYDSVMRCLELLELFVDIIYSPIETICLAGEHDLIAINANKLDNISTYLWIISLNITLIKAMRSYKQLSECKKMSLRGASIYNQGLCAVNNLMYNELLTCIRMILDLSFAISYLPSGILWGEKLSTWHIGAIGTVSSLIGLYQAYRNRPVKYE